MMYKKFAVVLAVIFSMTTLTGFGLKDLKPDFGKCSGEQKCKNKEKLKSAAKIAAIGIAAKIVADMIINYKSSQTKSEQVVISEQKAKNKQLPEYPTVNSYVTTVLPGKVIKVGQATTVQSVVYVTPGRSGGAVNIEEKMELLDDKKESFKQAVKQVNASKQKGGEFKNEFSFTIPQGMPDGVYTVKNTILFDGKQQEVTNTNIQFVLTTLPFVDYQLAYVR